MNNDQKSNEVTAYINVFTAEQQTQLNVLRAFIIQCLPQAEEKISYGIPTYKWTKNIIHFGGFKNHIGLFPGAKAIAAFQEELSKYKTSKGTVQIPWDQELPTALIQKIILFNVKEMQSKKK